MAEEVKAKPIKMTDVKLPILKPGNYQEWKIKISSLLKAKGLFVMVESAPTEVEKLSAGFDQVNEEAKSVIYSSIDGKTTQAAGICESAHDLWMKVTSIFEGMKDDVTGLAMSRFMEMEKRNNEKLTEYLGRFEIALNNLKTASVFVDSAMVIYVLVKTLPQNIKDAVKIWRTVNTYGTTDELISYIRTNYREEEAQQTAKDAAFFGAKKYRRWNKNKTPAIKNNQPGVKSKANSNASCTYCKKTGHVWQDCYKLKNDNNRKDAKRKEKAHMALERSYQVYQDYVQTSALYWIIDSGATSHMTHDKYLLQNFKEFKTPREIEVGDGEHIQALGSGWIFLRGKKEPSVLKNVLWVPKLPVNLFSVRAAVRDGYSIEFTKNNVRVQRNGQNLKAYFDGCLFTITLDILNLLRAETLSHAFMAYPIQAWHRRLNHCGNDLIKRMAKSGMVDGLTIGETPISCTDCMQGKGCRRPHPPRTQIQASKSMAILHFDTVDTSTTSLGGKRYFILGTEEYSGYKLIDFVAKKSEITNCVKIMINSVMINTHRPVVCIYSDNGTEFVNSDLREWLGDRGIIHELSAAYNPEQNGRAEASNKQVINGARTCLISSQLPKSLWAEACNTSVYVLNRLPSITSPNKTRYELYFGNKPDYSNLHEFGEVVMRIVPKGLRANKLDPVATPYRFVGYTNRFNTFRLYDESKQRIIIDSNVKFTNKQPERKSAPTEEQQQEYASIRWESQAEVSQDLHKQYSDYWDEQPNGIDDNMSVLTEIYGDGGENRSPNYQEDPCLEPEQVNQAPEADQEITPPRNINDAIHEEILQRAGATYSRNRRDERSNSGSDTPNRPVTRSQTGNLCPIYDPKSLVPGYQRDQPTQQEARESSSKRKSVAFDIALYSLMDEPQTVEQAKASKDWKQWQQAMKEEIQALEENNTWIIVDKPPKVRPIKAKWIFKLKLNPDGSVERYKARLVAKGYSQIPDIDYKQTFAPVASMTTVRMLLAASVQFNMKVVQFDIKTAFLHGDLEEELYMECPEYYEAPEGKVCKLVKSLYGLKQAPRQWHKKFDSFLKKFKLLQSEYDSCLYYSEDRSIMLTIYVDDGLIVAETEALAKELIDFLKEFLEVKTMDCKSYLGLEIIRRNQKMFVTQRQYVGKTLERFGMSNCKPASTPEEMTAPDFASSPKLSDSFPFKELVGCLLYIVTCTRPDIAHAVSVASRTAEPTEAHWACLKRILRYLKGSQNLGLEYRRSEQADLIGYSDADYANDHETRRSTTGFVIFWGDNLISWKCQRQTIVTLSTTEAEYVAGTEMVKRLIPLGKMMRELKLIADKPTTVYIDNKSTVNIATNEERQDRTKHIDVRHKWLTEHHKMGHIKIKHVAGEQQKADILTKPLHPTKFQTNRNWLTKLASVFLALILLVFSPPKIEGVMFKRTQPVYYRSSDIDYLDQLRRYHYKIVLVNPCEIYFKSITDSVGINSQLIRDCHDAFNRVARLDHCHNNTARIARRDVSGDVSKFFTKIGDSVGITTGKLQTIDLKEPVKTPIVRDKRFIDVVATVGVIIVASNQIQTSQQVNVNTSNIKELKEATNKELEFLRKSYTYLNETRNTIHDMNDRVASLEYKYEKLNHTMERFPRAIALVNKYQSDFKDLTEILADLDNAALQKKASTSIFKLSRNHTLTGLRDDQLTLESCGEETGRDDTHVSLIYRFVMPQINHKVKIMKAESFRFWNMTTPNKFCWMKYSGPRYVLVNSSISCYLDVQEYWLNDKTVSGHPCLIENKPLDKRDKLFNQDVCRTNFTGDTANIQVKTHNGVYKIYCFGNKIIINGKNIDCPDYVFELPLAEKFELNNQVYDLGEISTVTINAVEQHIDSQLSDQLKTDKIKIYGSNLTMLDGAFNRLSFLTDSISENVKLKEITTITSPIGSWISSKARALWDTVMGWLSGLETVIAVILFILAIIVIFPVLEIALILWKACGKFVTAISWPISRAGDSAIRVLGRRRRPTLSRNRIREYLTRSHLKNEP